MKILDTKAVQLTVSKINELSTIMVQEKLIIAINEVKLKTTRENDRSLMITQ